VKNNVQTSGQRQQAGPLEIWWRNGMKRALMITILAISFSASTGCTMMSDVRSNMTDSVKMFRPRPFDEGDESQLDRSEDKWADDLREARPDTQLDADPDDWWWDKVMSPQSRSIERSLGIGQ
jgi:hypothetical protein